MIRFITNLLRITILAFFINTYLKRIYPKQYNNILVTISFNVIYTFSVIQIKLQNVKKYLYMTNPRISELLELYNKQNNVDYVLDGKIIYSTPSYTSNTDKPTSFDFIIYSDYTNQDNNKKLIENSDDYNYEKSDIKFILVELKIGDNTYKIDLKSNTFDFYLCGNSFTQNFFKYYLNEILKLREHVDDNNKWSIKIIDHNVVTVEMEFTDKNESILLEKTDYKLLNVNNEEK